MGRIQPRNLILTNSKLNCTVQNAFDDYHTIFFQLSMEMIEIVKIPIQVNGLIVC